MSTIWHGPQIHSWRKFARHVRKRNLPLLKRLDEFPNSILVTGCQRSGTTMLARAVSRNPMITKYGITKDDELAAALILSGYVQHDEQGRHCFQTTYLNEKFGEYFELKEDHRMLWVIRSPMSVVYSMVYNWKRFALDELFHGVGIEQLEPSLKNRFNRYGKLSISPLLRACHAYNGKVLQLHDIKQRWPASKLFIVDYDQLVTRTSNILPRIFEFLELPYDPAIEKMVLKTSLGKANNFATRQVEIVERICMPIYLHASRLLSEQ